MAKQEIAIRGAQAGAMVTLPTWTDSTSIAAFVTSLLTGVNAIITLVQPGFHYPVAVTASVAPVSLLIAAAVVLANIFRHSKATVAAISR
jgi:hypothetical protein